MGYIKAVQHHCHTLRLSTMKAVLPETIAQAEREAWSYDTLLTTLFEQEIEGRRLRRIERFLKRSQLPIGKTWAQFDQNRLPRRVQKQVARLRTGEFVAKAENVLLFGLPGTGKTHLAAALGHELVNMGQRVLFIAAFRLVGRLLKAKQELELERELKTLDRFDVVILDDIGYIQQSREEMEVLFTFLSERYERRSVIITSNLVFSQWSQIFKDPLTTAAAIDRVVHHSTIIEFGSQMRSKRIEDAAQRNDRQIDWETVSADTTARPKNDDE